ncbi:MAG TPA: hypothetical protein VMW69_07610, partial [Spirochaetia bacterium]|nr:hypothetical protein [Spirochaetia bacterium]
KEYEVEPRKYHGRLLHHLPELRNPLGEIYVELYLTEPRSTVGLYKQGTRVVEDISSLEGFDHSPWSSGYVEGIVDASFIQLTPGTRGGVIFDSALHSLTESLKPLEEALSAAIDEQRRAEEEEASRSILRKVTKALREAFLMLPREEYGWLEARQRGGEGGARTSGEDSTTAAGGTAEAEGGEAADGLASRDQEGQRSFFEYPGPLFRLLISPRSARVLVGESARLRAVARDKSKRPIDSGISFEWRLVEGAGSLEPTDAEFVEYRAPAEPEVAVVEVTVREGSIELAAQATITVVAELVPHHGSDETAFKNGLPGYTYRRAAGETWRSRYEIAESLIVINNGHADFIFASRSDSTKLRYIARLYAKEIVLANFPGSPSEELLERMVELTLYVEDNLR